jgi:hypothetical protein
MFNEYMKFTKKQPLTGVILGASLIYGANMVRKAFIKPEGKFWPGQSGIGASTSTTSSTSSSHSMMDRKTSGDMMTHPIALYGIGANHTNPDPDMTRVWHSYGPGRGGQYRWVNEGQSGQQSQSGQQGQQSSGSQGQGDGRGDGRGDGGSDASYTAGYKSPLSLMGVPSYLKRRVGNSEDSESYQPTNVVTPEVETVETVLGWI